MTTISNVEHDREDELLRLQRMEVRLVDALLDHPGAITRTREHQIRYALALAALDEFQPGAARRGARIVGPDVRVRTPRLTRVRKRVLENLGHALLQSDDRRERLDAAAGAVEPLLEAIDAAREEIIEKYADAFTARQLDQELGIKTLVSVAGGGGGSAYVYVGAWHALQDAGYVPGYVVGSSMGAILGLFRARDRRGDFDAYLKLAKSLRSEIIFRYVSLRTRFGFPGIARLFLRPGIAASFEDEDGDELRLSDLDIPFDAVVAGVRRGALEESPDQYARSHHLHEDKRPHALQLRAQVAIQLVRMLAFINPRVVKEIVVGRDELTEDFNAIDAAGFSAAIPGLLHYDVTREDAQMEAILTGLMEREDVVALVDGGVANNVPVGPAWRQVRDGRIGTRNAYYLAFDCFHPQAGLGHVWLQPLTRIVSLQVALNERYAHQRVEFAPTLSPVNLLPRAPQLDLAVAWGRARIEAELPRLEKFFERVRWTSPKRSRKG